MPIRELYLRVASEEDRPCEICGAKLRNIQKVVTGEYLCEFCRFDCKKCRKPTNFRNTVGVDGEAYCSGCADNLETWTCRGCEELFLQTTPSNTYRLRNYCYGCVTRCASCDDNIPNAVVRYDRYDDPHCTICYNQTEECSPILDYSARAEAIFDFLGNPKDNLYFGVELEVECRKRKNDMAVKVNEILEDFAICKEDCSVTRGFEIVTAPASFDVHKERWEAFLTSKDIKDGIHTFGESNGMHIHFSRNALGASQLGRMMVFMYERQNSKFMEMIAGRSLRKGNGGSFSRLDAPRKLTECSGVTSSSRYNGSDTRRMIQKPKDSTMRKVMYNKRNFHDRGALNDLNHQTVEMRIFAGTIQKELFYKNLEFAHSLIKFCVPGVASIKSLNSPTEYTDYVSQFRKTYPNLHQFIQKEWIATKGSPKIRVQGYI